MTKKMNQLLMILCAAGCVMVVAGCTKTATTDAAVETGHVEGKAVAAKAGEHAHVDTKAAPAEAACRDACGSHAKEPAAEEAEKESKPGSLTREQILAAKCSHGLVYQCDECRYEVGLVKVDASLFNGVSGQSNGLVRLALAERKKVTSAISITGEIRLNENAAVHLSPRIAGTIRKVHVDIGAQVKTNDVLFELESVELGQTLSDYEKNQTLVELSRKNTDREKRLVDQKIGAETDLIEAQMTLAQHQNDLKASEQKLHVLGLAESDIAAINRDDHESLRGTLPVRAPIAGTIIEKHAVVGERVEPGRDVMVLADLSTMWVWGSVYERDLAVLLKRMSSGGIPLAVSVRAFPGISFTGTVDHVGAIMDPATRTVKLRATIDNKDGFLRAGMFCDAQLLIQADKDVLAVPKDACLSDEGLDFVFTPFKDDYFLRQPVKKGLDYADDIEILEGLTEGQSVVSHGAFLLKSDVLRSKMGAGCAD